MLGWLENNPVGKVLASVIGGMVVLALLLGVLWSLPPSAPSGTDDADGELMGLDIPQLKAGEPIEKFAVITERPVFNPSRLPVIVEDDEGEDEEETEEEEVEAPEVELTGVVITPSIRMATLKLTSEDSSLVAFENQPLEGDFGSWKVSRIEPRRVVLSSGTGDEVELELQVHDAVIAEPPKVAAETKEDKQSPARDAEEGEDRPPMSRAEEIRQRIAERREELRRAAEESGEAPAQDAKPADYRSAIQSLMTGRKDQAKDEDDQ